MQQTDYFDELKSAVTNAPDYKILYREINSVYKRCLDDYTRGNGLQLSSPFAKTDYLLKENNAPKHISQGINDTRQTLRTYWNKTEAELSGMYRTDLRNLCEFLSMLTGESVPTQLRELYPEYQMKHKKGVRLGEYLRVIIVRWDNDYAYCHSETAGEDELKVCYSKDNQFYPFNRSYLRDLFYEGAQFNLIHPEQRKDIIYPELWIFEPDYLVNISSVATCFENNTDSAIICLLKRIDKKESTQHTLLGNLASQLLDESINQLPNSHTYADSAKEFFSNYALSILATDDIDKEFHKQARIQKQNIQHAINQTLPQWIKRFDSKNGIVEPSFYCEMLGLHGRMDYLQLDMKVLIEQKSGKGEYPQNYNGNPFPKTEHIIQLLLYMAVLRYNFGREFKDINKELRPFLLYSKYSQSLYPMQSRPEQLFNALKIRNQIVWNDIIRIPKEGYSLLTTLTPNMLKGEKIREIFWEQFICPRLERLLTPIKNCRELERLYCLRMLKFVGEEHLVSKLGNKEKEDSGFASTWLMNLDEKKQNGTILTGLSIDIPYKMRGKRIFEVDFEFDNTSRETRYITNLRVGDIVVIHPYNRTGEPDLRTTMAIRGTLKALGKERLTVKLRFPQSDSRIFDYYSNKVWAIENDYMESSFTSTYSNVYSFLSTTQERRDLLLLQRSPRVDMSRELKGDYGAFNELSLRVKQACELFLIIGPPGTGKTSYGMLNTLKEELLESGSRVLLMSYTNRAVDEMCSKLQEEGIDFLRIGSELSCDQTQVIHHINTISKKCNNLNDLKNMIDSYRVIAGTVHAFNSQLQYLSKKHFSLAIIDEASQLLESQLLGLLCCYSEERPPIIPKKVTIDKFVLIGDHKQLPAVVQQEEENSKVEEALLNDIGLTDCRQSFFERLLKKFNNNKHVVYMLTRHGRMHPEIADFPNQIFYNGKLIPVPLPHQKVKLPTNIECSDTMECILLTKRIAFVNVEGSECAKSDKSNTHEAIVIADLLRSIYKLEGDGFDPSSTVGVIVPYRNQIATIRSVLSEQDNQELSGITIDTVERFQGSQRKYIIYGFTIQKRYQLRFLTGNVFTDYDGTVVDRKLNVAMTRAQEHLIMVGNPKIVCQDPIFRRLVAYIKAHNGYYEEKEMH